MKEEEKTSTYVILGKSFHLFQIFFIPDDNSNMRENQKVLLQSLQFIMHGFTLMEASEKRVFDIRVYLH